MLKKPAFTLIELLIVVAILAILTLTVLSSLSGQRTKGEDAKIKADLARLKIAFEDYYNDHNCYPPPAWFTAAANCGSTILAPYLQTLTCDPKTGLPYPVETDPTGCTWFKIYANLSTLSDPDLLSLTYSQGNVTKTANYGVSSSNISLLPSPAPSGSAQQMYYCQQINNCTLVPAGRTCTPSYPSPNCDSATGNPCAHPVTACH